MNKNFNDLTTIKLRTNKTKLHQSDARKYKDILHNAMLELFEKLEVDITMVQNAIVIEVPHDELGAIPIEVKFVIKPLDYDVITEGVAYKIKNIKTLEKKKDWKILLALGQKRKVVKKWKKSQEKSII